jgi:diguanylate cyclase (GGDEF)-like protein/PAS domain S-box-containing protein
MTTIAPSSTGLAAPLCSAPAPSGDVLAQADWFVQLAPDAFIHSDPAGRIIGFSPQAERMFGCAAAQALGRRGLEVVGLDLTGCTPALPSAPVVQRMERPCTRADGTVFVAEIALVGVLQQGQRFYCLQLRDITERKLAEEGLRITAAAFNSREGMVISDANGVILRVNPTFTAITGYSAAEAVGKKTNMLSSGRQDAAFYQAMWASIVKTGAWKGEIWNRKKSGEVYAEWLTVTAIRNAAGDATHYVGTFTDITARKAVEAEIQQLAFYDPLTGLPNRRLLMDRLKQALAAGRRYQRFGAVFFIDLDYFKTINDTLGHDRGDALRQQVSERLRPSVREGDTVARLGGDEFVVMLLDLSTHRAEAVAEVQAVGQKIVAALRQPYQLGSLVHHGSASVGASLFDEDVESAEELLKRADVALYQAKGAGRNQVCFFSQDDGDLALAPKEL